ncbi:GDSL-type esterase/lipase family protein [Streptomyces tritici]|uniref:GDSL-type esterase/lipase family protein n=1 Tax=Streptomyces tritici TaxID=2054410 RepID=UPI003AF0F5C8
MADHARCTPMEPDGTGGSWQDAGPFLRGTAWFDERGRAVRADPADLDRLPWDAAQRAALPVGIRLEFTAAPGTRAVAVRYRAEVPGRAEPLRDLAHCFALWEGGSLVGETCARPAEEAEVVLGLPPRPGPFTVHPPEWAAPWLLRLRGVGGAVAPAPPRPRWVVHGDSITEGWWATRPAHAWPAAAGRALGLDAVNLGYAGAARGELPTAEQLASLPADVLTLAFGTNCWGRTPHSAPLLYETTRAFLDLVRAGHPRTPLLLLSPVLRPAAESARGGRTRPCGGRRRPAGPAARRGPAGPAGPRRRPPPERPGPCAARAGGGGGAARRRLRGNAAGPREGSPGGP